MRIWWPYTSKSKINRQTAEVNLKDKKKAEVNLIKPENGISPGQACVFYKKDSYGYKILGGGWII